MNFNSIQNVVAGLRSSNHGLRHWLMQKVTAIILIPSTLLFVYFFSEVFGKGHQFVVNYFQNNMISCITAIFIVASLFHLKQGLQVIIEDYVHNNSINYILLKIVSWTTWLLSILSILSLGKVALVG